MRAALVLALLTLAGAADAKAPTEPVRRTKGWWNTRHAAINTEAVRVKPELIFLGDSITAGWERTGKEVWQRRYGERKAVNMGIGGDETGHLLWRLAHGNVQGIQPRLAVLLIGVNNAFRRDHNAVDIAAGVRAVVRDVRRRLPRTRVLLLAVFPAGARPGRLRGKIAAINRRIAGLADRKHVHYLDIGARFLEKDGRISEEVMFDYLHLTHKGYTIWADAMEPTLHRLLRSR